MMRRFILPAFIFLLVVGFTNFAIAVAVVTPDFPIGWWGNITIDSAPASAGTIVSTYADSTKFTETTTPSVPALSNNQYSIIGAANNGQILTIRVWDIVAFSHPWNSGESGNVYRQDLSVSRLLNGVSCSYNQSCVSGICCSSVCASSCGGSSGTGGGTGGGSSGGSSGNSGSSTTTNAVTGSAIASTDSQNTGTGGTPVNLSSEEKTEGAPAGITGAIIGALSKPSTLIIIGVLAVIIIASLVIRLRRK